MITTIAYARTRTKGDGFIFTLTLAAILILIIKDYFISIVESEHDLFGVSLPVILLSAGAVAVGKIIYLILRHILGEDIADRINFIFRIIGYVIGVVIMVVIIAKYNPH